MLIVDMFMGVLLDVNLFVLLLFTFALFGVLCVVCSMRQVGGFPVLFDLVELLFAFDCFDFVGCFTVDLDTT